MKTEKLFFSLLVVIAALVLVSCNRDEVAQAVQSAPTVSFEGGKVMYDVKVGSEITIEPLYEQSQNAVYSWSCEGEIISTDSTLTFSSDEVGEYYVTVNIINGVNNSSAEIKISVLKLLPPSISLVVPEDGYSVAVDVPFSLSSDVANVDSTTTFSWMCNGEEICSEQSLNYTFTEKGNYELLYRVANSDGEDFKEMKVAVLDQADLPFSWSFDADTLNMTTGRESRIKIWDVENYFSGEFLWKIDDKEVQKGSKTEYIFKESAVGSYTLSVSLENDNGVVATKDIVVNVCNGAVKRVATELSNPAQDAVYEFKPAPGQFVNERYVCNNMAEACAYAIDVLQRKSLLSLGAYGGYVVVGFDHSIENDGDYNIGVKGNPFKGSSEPGIVMVMQDENGDGLPNDTWYELAGCESVSGNQITDYSITYTRPATPQTSTPWRDNQGKVGYVDFNGFHSQEYYYPNWIESDELTFRGTALLPHIVETTPGYWVNGEYEWGYADNYSLIDNLDVASSNHLKISDAVDYKGDKVELEFIDFVKVYTAVNGRAGWLGENSTEVVSITDYNLTK